MTPSVSYRLLVLLLFAEIFGCGPSHPATAPVRGTVTWKGTPVPRGVVTFYPERGRPALGQIGADGSYELTTFSSSDGSTLGPQKVTIEVKTFEAVAVPKSMEEEIQKAKEGGFSMPPKVKWIVPSEYSRPETTPLSAVVERAKNVIDFNLPLP